MLPHVVGSWNDLVQKWWESYAVAGTFTRAQSNWTPSLECQITKTLFHITLLSAFIHHPLFDRTYAVKQTIKKQAHGFPFWWVRRANILLTEDCYCGFLYSTTVFSRTLRWMKEGQRDVGWRVTTRVQPSTNFNIQPSPSFPAISSPIEWEKERGYNRWEAAQKYLTCSRMRATVCVCVSRGGRGRRQHPGRTFGTLFPAALATLLLRLHKSLPAGSVLPSLRGFPLFPKAMPN